MSGPYLWLFPKISESNLTGKASRSGTSTPRPEASSELSQEALTSLI